MTDANEKRDELLRRLQMEELDRSSPEVQERLAQDPAFAKRLEELEQMLATLCGAGELEREILAAAEQEAEPPGLDRIASVLAEHADAPKRRTWIVAGAALAAAILLIVTLIFFGWGEPGFPDTGRRFLGTGGLIVELEPTPGGFESFRWSHGRDDVRFRLTVMDPLAEDETVLHQLETPGRSWSPALQETGDWPEYVRWEVVVLDPLGQPLARASGGAVRSP